MSEAANQEIQQETQQETQEPAQETNEQQPQETAQEDIYSVSSQAAELAQREAQLAKSQQELELKLQEVQSMQQQHDAAKEDPIKLLESLGVSYEDLTNKYIETLGEPQKTDAELALEKIDQLENQLNSAQEQQKQRDEQVQAEEQRQKYDSALVQIANFVGENNEKYELVNKMQASDLVLNVIGEHYNSTGEILDMATACQAVEEHYEEEAQRYLASEKLLNKMGLKKIETQQGNQDTRPKTLTNNIGTTAPRYNDDRPLSRQESLEKAASLLKWV